MEYIFLLARLYPYWVTPIGIVLFEIGIHMKRRRNKSFLALWIISSLMIITVLIWIIMRGDLNSDNWIKFVFQTEHF